MKKFTIIIVAAFMFGCGSNSNKTNTVDTMNGIHQNPAQDTQPGAAPDGYTPPNTTTDTSHRVKDSIKNAGKQ